MYKSHEAISAKRILAKGTPPKFIVWKHWEDAFAWDQQHCLPLHHKLKPEHFELTASSLMRNHLAEQVLNKDMLNLMKVLFNFIISGRICYFMKLQLKNFDEQTSK